MVSKVINIDLVKEMYAPSLADNIKWIIRNGDPDYLAEHKGDYLKLWLQLGLKYPLDYFDAYVNQTYGYYYPRLSGAVIIADGICSVSDHSIDGFTESPIISGDFADKIRWWSEKFGSILPLYSLLWSPGILCWVFLLCMACCIIRKEKAKLVYYLPSFALYLTVLIATPVATEFRYVYFMAFALPFYLAVCLLPSVNKD